MAENYTVPWTARAIELEPKEGHYSAFAAFEEWAEASADDVLFADALDRMTTTERIGLMSFVTKAIEESLEAAQC